MKIAVLYDSYFGNNKQIAEEIAQCFKTDVTLSYVPDFIIDGPYDLLILGCPTRAMRPTKPMLQFIKTLTSQDAKKVAIYDTRMVKENLPKFLVWMMKLFGHAIETMEQKLRKKDPNWLLDKQYFEVVDSKGPLADQQTEKAREWALSLKDNLHT